MVTTSKHGQRIGDTPLALELIRYEATSGNTPQRPAKWFLLVTRHCGGPELISIDAKPDVLLDIEKWCARAREVVATDGGRRSLAVAVDRDGDAK